MLWVKAFHLIFVASWFAALFYLPRIFVNLVQVPDGSHAERDRLLGMARRLHRFGGLLMVVGLALGVWLWLGFGVGRQQTWMHVKLALIVVAIGYHHGCGRLLRQFDAHSITHSERWFRVFNEGAVLLFAAIVVLVIVKPW